MGKFHISFCKEIRCFLEKFTQLENFTRPPVVMVATNFKSVLWSSGATSVQKNSGSPQFSLSHKSTWTGTSPAGTAHTGARSLFLAEDFTAMQFSIDFFKLSLWVIQGRCLGGPKFTW